MRRLKLLALAAALSLSSTAYADETTIASWNIEHLAPENGQGCAARTSADYLELKRFAEDINADVYALQEVDSVRAVARVFDPSKYDIIVSDRPTKKNYKCRGNGNISTNQNVGFAIKKGVAYSYNPDENLTELALTGSLRYGLTLTLTDSDTKLVNVHLKSGCYDTMPSNSKNCKTKQKQTLIIKDWIAKQKGNVILTGDFNHTLAEPNDYVLNMMKPLRLNSGALIGCHPKYPKPIDHVVSNLDISNIGFVSFRGKNGVSDLDSMLSDHCPLKFSVKN